MGSTKKSRKASETRVAGGLDKVLYVRAGEELLTALDAVAESQRRQTPGKAVSRSDVARTLLWQAVRRARKDTEWEDTRRSERESS